MMSVLRRPVLFLSAAATIAVPGALAAVAMAEHGHVAQSSVAQAASGPGGMAQSASGQLAPDLRAGVPVPAAALAVARDQARGAQLLTAAAAADTSMSYEGVEVIADTTVGGTMTVVATVWHQGGHTVTQTSNATAVAASEPYDVSYDGDNRQPEGVFGVTATQVRLLAPMLVRRLNDELGDGSVARVKVRGPAAPRQRGGWRVPGSKGPGDTYG